MSKNYYVRPPGACQTQCDNWIHLGQSSAGWQFAFQAYPPTSLDAHDGRTIPVVEDYESWLTLLDLGEIYDEHGVQLTRDQMIERVESKRTGRQVPDGTTDKHGHTFIAGWFE